MMFLDHYVATTKHKGLVMWYIIKFCGYILWRGITHDLSKYRDPEAVGFALNLKRSKSEPYRDASEYEARIFRNKSLSPSILHHHKVNRHHPEYHERGIQDMNLFDIVEMLCDWVATARAAKKGHVFVSIETGGKRFNIPKELSLIFRNTVKEAKKK